jgi:hypothetical protein
MLGCPSLFAETEVRMPNPADDHKADNVIHLNFAAREIPQVPSPMRPFLLDVRPDGWKLHHGGAPLEAEDLSAAADLLRDIARGLSAMARQAAGGPEEPCIAEFVLYRTGGVDHWIAGDADRNRLRLGLRTAISSIREP